MFVYTQKHAMAHMWRSEDYLVFSFCHTDPRNQTEVIRLDIRVDLHPALPFLFTSFKKGLFVCVCIYTNAYGGPCTRN